ncbi:MAG TPA: MFS transporter [Candidatus Baltobacteraceae bacterium]|nr:MFS transporter [Candidatus Baltobacteraceae bacterium]
MSLRTLGLIAGCDVLAMATWFSASAVIVPLASAFGIAPGDRGWITATVQFGFVTAALGSASIALTDWVEPRTLIRSGMLVAGLANAAIAFVHAPALLLFLRFLTGAGLALVYPPTVRLLTGWFPRSRGVVTGIAVGALTIGSFSPHVFSGDLPWRTVMLVASGFAFLGIPLMSMVALPPSYQHAGRFDMRAVPAILSNRDIVLADAGYWGHMWELYAVWAWGPVFYAATLQASHIRAPAGVIVFALFGVVGAAGCVLAGVLGDRYGRASVAGTALAVSGTVSLCIGWAFGGNPWLVTTLFALWGFTVVADSGQFSAAVTEYADQRYVGTALTFQMGVGFLITMVTIWLVGAVQATAGWGNAFSLLAVGPAAGVYAMIALYRRTRRR